MFILEQKSKEEYFVEELPDDDAGIIEIIKYNSKRLFREYLGTQNKRKVALDIVCFGVACFAMKNYGDLLSV